MFGTYITFSELLILIPLLGGVLCFVLARKSSAKAIALATSIITLLISVASVVHTDPAINNVSYLWLKYIGSNYSVGLDGTGRILTLLTAMSFPLIFIATYKTKYKNQAAFYGLMLLSQAGIMGVFVAYDALLFYFFWELALIPIYFLCSRWGGSKRIKTTFKFFVYTFGGSLLMLVGLIYVYLHTPGRVYDGIILDHSFSLQAFYNAQLSNTDQAWLFWLFFVAFAIKMPVFPFHTWQPDTYEQATPAVTMVLSGIMVKMGLLGVIRWLIPVFPAATEQFAEVVMWLSIAGIIYASCIALVQDNLKKLVAYSSIAHMGLMCAALFSLKSTGIQGVMLQMFSHGINIIGMWIVLGIIQRKTGSISISQLGGMAQKAPGLAIFMVIIAFANISLPLTNAFVGEFMMFAGVWQANNWMTVVAALSIILAATYTLVMVRKVFYGSLTPITQNITDSSKNEMFVLSVIVVAIFMMGVFPQPMINISKEAVASIINLYH